VHDDLRSQGVRVLMRTVTPQQRGLAPVHPVNGLRGASFTG
jgi:hypothetical protein